MIVVHYILYSCRIFFAYDSEKVLLLNFGLLSSKHDQATETSFEKENYASLITSLQKFLATFSPDCFCMFRVCNTQWFLFRLLISNVQMLVLAEQASELQNMLPWQFTGFSVAHELTILFPHGEGGRSYSRTVTNNIWDTWSCYLEHTFHVCPRNMWVNGAMKNFKYSITTASKQFCSTLSAKQSRAVVLKLSVQKRTSVVFLMDVCDQIESKWIGTPLFFIKFI